VNADERGFCCFGLGREDRILEPLEVVAVGDRLHVPVIGLEALGHVLGVAELGGAIEGDQVVVVEDDELAEAEGSGQRSYLVGDAFHEVAIAAENVGEVVHDVVGVAVIDGGEVLLCCCDADGHAESLA